MCMAHAVEAGQRIVGILPPDSALARSQARTYAEHNVTHRHYPGGGVDLAEPNSPAEQCQCGDCASHRRRAPSQTADKGKSVEVSC